MAEERNVCAGPFGAVYDFYIEGPLLARLVLGAMWGSTRDPSIAASLRSPRCPTVPPCSTFPAVAGRLPACSTTCATGSTCSAAERAFSLIRVTLRLTGAANEREWRPANSLRR
jgi:hypothetical protein